MLSRKYTVLTSVSRCSTRIETLSRNTYLVHQRSEAVLIVEQQDCWKPRTPQCPLDASVHSGASVSIAGGERGEGSKIILESSSDPSNIL